MDHAVHKPADIHLVVEVELHDEVVLAGDRVDLGDLLDLLHGRIRHVVGPAELALHHHEDGLHQPASASAFAFASGTGRSRKLGTWPPKASTALSDAS